MSVFLLILAILAFLFGGSILADAKSAIHEIEGFSMFLISAVCLSGAGIIEAVHRLRKLIEKEAKK